MDVTFLHFWLPTFFISDDIYKDYMEDVCLANYQRCTGEEVLAEKLMREKRSKGPTLHTRRTDLPKYFNAYIVFIRQSIQEWTK